MGCPALCSCKMVQGSGRCRLESVEVYFVRDNLPFHGGSCFALAKIFGAVEVSALVTAGVGVAGLYFLYQEKVNPLYFVYCSKDVCLKTSYRCHSWKLDAVHFKVLDQYVVDAHIILTCS